MTRCAIAMPLLTVGLLSAGCYVPKPYVKLVYQVVPGDTESLMITEDVVSALSRRLGDDASVYATADGTIEIDLFDLRPENVESVRRRIESPGSLEFRIVANRHDHLALIERAEADAAVELYEDQNPVAKWLPVAPDVEEPLTSSSDFAVRPLSTPQKEQEGSEILVVVDPYDVTGKFLERVSDSLDQSGRPSINFKLNSEGAMRFSRLTGDNLPDTVTGRTRNLAIVLNGVVHSAPSLHARITDRAEITGQFTKQDVQELAAILSGGELPAEIRFVKQITIP